MATQQTKVSDKHKSIFHYTSLEGLYGIIESQELWATHYEYLNDTREIVAARALLEPAAIAATEKHFAELQKSNLLTPPPEIPLAEMAQHDGAKVVEVLYRVTFDHVVPFIFSFCSHQESTAEFEHGLLSQWRGYARDGGFAIEFDTKGIEACVGEDAKLNVHSAYGLADVVYGDEANKPEDLQADIDKVANLVRMLSESDEEAHKRIESTYLPFINCATRIKTRFFEEEREIRLVHVVPKLVPQDRKPAKKIEFRRQRSEKVPFVKLFESAEIKLPIKRILVGPHPKSAQRAKTISMLLEARKVDAKVSVSGMPYLPE